MKKILIANIFGIGDVLFTTPLIASLKKELKNVTIDYLCNARTKEVVQFDPDVEDIFVYEKDDFGKLWKESKLRFFGEINKLFSGIRRKKYDAVFDFTLSREFGMFFMLAGVRRRIGLAYKKRGMFLTDKKPLEGFADRHVVEYYLDLLEFAGVSASVRELQLVPDEASLEWAEKYLTEKSMGEGRVVAVVPGGGASWGPQASRKRWHVEAFAKTSDILAEQGCSVLVLGDPSENELCRKTADTMSTVPKIVENSLSLKNYMALLAKCDLVLCNDGGPLHMAVALGVKTVSIFGPVDEKVYGPYPGSYRNKVITASEIPCRPCYGRFKLPECDNGNRCLTDIDPETVADSCMELLVRGK